ncbi:uncharacterized protein HMPREF1541_02210 [Cyphellophora europaea CBS 101466]|uniref:Transcription factor domain-containing protein n=1 Tax=Cyphellophora europaea (strain CBS 101466) TaxID=1220924 RepID=W2S2Y4_CYPE1|nr:uncharacterized protein HMPREF1541_02210 [Cyphellophora europaea CBS 101466]ETN43052.1 hypothetical protein HMPREF1541_02210 [Cyphellophora europaea CBS 101466]
MHDLTHSNIPTRSVDIGPAKPKKTIVVHAKDTFINYSHPAQLADRARRRKVSSYIGVHFRNRSRPLVRKQAKEKQQNEVHCSKAEQAVATLAYQDDASTDTTASETELGVPRDGHGLRNDPFETWPIQARASIPVAVDYFLQFYAPAHTVRPDLFSPEGGAQAVKDYFRYALQQPLMFETIVALSHANLFVSTWTDHCPDSQTLFHYGSALKRLRSQIASEDPGISAHDAVLFAIVALMGIDFLMSDMVTFQTHLSGLRRLVALRGGIEFLGWPSLLKPSIVGLETFWTYICSAPNLLRANIPITATPIEPISLSPSPQMPSTNINHCGYSDAYNDMSSLIASLQPGYRRLALECNLSPCIIDLVHKVLHFDINLHHYPNGMTRYGQPILSSNAFASSQGTPLVSAANLAVTEYAAAALASPQRTPIERLICISLLTTLLDMTRHEKLSPLYAQQLRLFEEEVLAYPLDDSEPAVRDLVAWLSLNLGQRILWPPAKALPPGWRDDRCTAMVMKVVRHFSGRWSYERLQKDVLMGFVWTDACQGGMKMAWNLGLDVLRLEREEEEALAKTQTQTQT